MKLLLVAGPRPYWPFLHEQDNFLVPQALVVLAAAARRAGIQTRIVDCLPLKIGYRSLARLLHDESPDVVAVGENHALYAAEALRVCAIAKREIPGVRTVAGGAHFSNTVETTLADEHVDFIAIGEGERILVNLLTEMTKPNPDYRHVRGLAFHSRVVGDSPLDGQVTITEPEPLIEDLDAEGLPAYDLLPMERYGRSKYLFSPGGTTIHHGRGCTGRCSFCAFWVQMAERVVRNGRIELKPRWRTKSPGAAVEEVELLARRYGKKALVFVDETFNIDPRWNDAFADELLRRRLKVNWFAFMRADFILRDERLGIMEKLVRAGLRHVCIGAERASDAELTALNKPFYTGGAAVEAFALLRRKYPEVFRQATFIVGVRDESRESMRDLGCLARELQLDFPAFHPLTPVPGTPLWDRALAEGWLETKDFGDFDWSTPVMPSKFLSRDEISALMDDLTRANLTPQWYLKGLLSPHTYRRRMFAWWTMVSLKVALAGIKERLNPFQASTYQRLVYPKWYDT